MALCKQLFGANRRRNREFVETLQEMEMSASRGTGKTHVSLLQCYSVTVTVYLVIRWMTGRFGAMTEFFWHKLV